MAREGLIGIVMCNASQLVPPWQGKQPRFGTNPICMALPGEESWLLDMATTTVAAGKIFKAHINQQPEIPVGWAMDRDGVPTTKTEEAYQGLLMPLGGYKGYGLALMAEILSGVLSGGGFAMDIGGIRVRGRPTRISQVYLAIDIARFMPVEEFQERMDRLVEMLKSSAPAKGYDEVLIAGEPERRKEAQRRAEGIPVESGNWAGLCEFAAKLGIAVPE
jgi:LDH2 family malate/lactate/ureidoglycolate dehydrogenase